MPLKQIYSHKFISTPFYFCLLAQSRLLKRASQAIITLSRPSAPGHPFTENYLYCSSLYFTPYFSGKVGSSVFSNIPLISPNLVRRQTKKSQSPLLKFYSASLPAATQSLASGRQSSMSSLNHSLGGISLMAKAVKRAATNAPRQPKGLWCVILPDSIETETSFYGLLKKYRPMHAALIEAPHPPPCFSNLISFQFSPVLCNLFALRIQVPPGALPVISLMHALQCLANFTHIVSNYYSGYDQTRALAVAICMTVSSLQGKPSLYTYSPWIPSSFVISINS